MPLCVECCVGVVENKARSKVFKMSQNGYGLARRLASQTYACSNFVINLREILTTEMWEGTWPATGTPLKIGVSVVPCDTFDFSVQCVTICVQVSDDLPLQQCSDSFDELQQTKRNNGMIRF